MDGMGNAAGEIGDMDSEEVVGVFVQKALVDRLTNQTQIENVLSEPVRRR